MTVNIPVHLVAKIYINSTVDLRFQKHVVVSLSLSTPCIGLFCKYKYVYFINMKQTKIKLNITISLLFSNFLTSAGLVVMGQIF